MVRDVCRWQGMGFEIDVAGAVAVVLRFAHVLAAIMWIGDSLLFTWIELSLVRPVRSRDPDGLLGTLDMLHGGGVFHLEKRVLHPEAIPERLHWFKWQSYTTWLTGFLLLATLFYGGEAGTLIDPTKTSLPNFAGALLSLAGLVGGWLVYDILWRSPLRRHAVAAIAVSFLVLMAVAWAYSLAFNGRAMFLQIGAMLGTMMSANVFFHIIPNQRKFMAALRAGRPHDLNLSRNAKERSLHNHYMTFPVLFLMLSAHFPQLCGAAWNVAVLGVLIPGLALVKFLMNARHFFRHWLPVLCGVVVAGSAVIAVLLALPSALAARSGGTPPVAQGRQLFVSKGCAACHVEGSSQLAPELAGIFGTRQALRGGGEAVVDEAYIRESILHPHVRVVEGYAPAMPPYQGRLTEAQMEALVQYVRSLTPEASPPPP